MCLTWNNLTHLLNVASIDCWPGEPCFNPLQQKPAIVFALSNSELPVSFFLSFSSVKAVSCLCLGSDSSSLATVTSLWGQRWREKQDVWEKDTNGFLIICPHKEHNPLWLFPFYFSFYSDPLQGDRVHCSQGRAETHCTPIPQSSLLNKVALHLSCPCSSGKKLKAATH